MPMQRVQITRPLRKLIRDTRAAMTQREAAEAADVSLIWWRQVETGVAPFATARTVARMCRAVGVEPASLRAVGEAHVADLMETPRRSERGAMEAHIMATPELSDAQRSALVVMAQALRATA